MRQEGLTDYCGWLVTSPQVDCCVLAAGMALGTGNLRAQLARAQAERSLERLIGRPGPRWSERQARLSVGKDPASGEELLWAVTPVEADLEPATRLEVGLLLGRDGGGIVERLEGALAEATFRHSTTQPLTALTFLLENLLYAFLQAAPDAAYLARKRSDLEGQAARLGELMAAGAVLPREAG